MIDRQFRVYGIGMSFLLVAAGGIIYLSAPLWNLTLDASEIRRIRPRQQFIELQHSGGTVQLERSYDGFHEFLSLLKEENPHVDIRGLWCPV